MAKLSSTIFTGFIASAKYTGKMLIKKGQEIPEIVEDFISGFMGTGWKIWKRAGSWILEIDEIVVRKTMTVFELLIQKIRAVKGAMAITQGNGKVSSINITEEEVLLTIDDEMSFMEHDIILCQEFSGNMRRYHVEISKIENDIIHIPITEFETGENEDGIVVILNSPKIGDDIVQFGNSSKLEQYKGRHSAIYLHSDESGQPAIDLLEDIYSKDWSNCIKTRIGGMIPDTDGKRGFYTVNGMIKGVDGGGSVMYYINPDGEASFGQGGVLFRSDKSGNLAEGAIAWRWDKDLNKFITTMGDVILTWDNLSQEVKDNLKGDKGDDAPEIIDIYILSEIPPLTPTGQTIPPEDWSIIPLNPSKGNYLWLSQAKKTGSSLSEWSAPIRFSGADGQAGKDGTDIEFIYKLTPNGISPSTPESEQDDDNIPKGWTDNPTGVSSIDLYEWICVRYKKSGVWGSYSNPAVWSKWGEKGQDGDGVEYIYRLTESNVKPETPESLQEEDYTPDGWTDDPTGVSASYMYEWVCTRKSNNSIWGEFSNPAIWAKWGETGQAGLSIVWKGDLSSAPLNPELNWVYRNTLDGMVYIYDGNAWTLMSKDGNDGENGTDGTDGLSVFITYHDSREQPEKPIGVGNTGGWHTNPTPEVVWISQKVAANASEGEWSVPIRIKGFDANLLPWVEDWNSNKTEIGADYVISPKMFSGTRNEVTKKLTGVAFGRDSVEIDGVLKTGIFGVKDGKLTFSVDAETGDAMFEGTVYANAGKFTGEVNATSGVFKNVDIESGKVGGFDIDVLGLTNEGLDNNAYIIMRNDILKTHVGIGANVLSPVLAATSVAKFFNERLPDKYFPGDNVGVQIKAVGSSTENIAISILAGYVSGLNLKVSVLSEGPIPDYTSIVACDNTSYDPTFFLPANPETGKFIFICSWNRAIIVNANGKSLYRNGGFTSQVTISGSGRISMFIYDSKYWRQSYMTQN